MDPTVVVIVLASATLHPLWNAAVKDDDRPEGAFIGLVVMLLILAGAHSVIAGFDLTTIVHVWPLLALSCFGQLLYGTSLVMTFRRGDLSAYYPIIRSSPLFIVVVGVLFLDQAYTFPIIVGIVMVPIGAFALQYRRGFRLFDDPITLFFAVVALCGTGFYSIADSRAVQVVEPPVMLFWVEVFALPSYLIMFRLYGVVASRVAGAGQLGPSAGPSDRHRLRRLYVLYPYPDYIFLGRRGGGRDLGPAGVDSVIGPHRWRPPE